MSEQDQAGARQFVDADLSGARFVRTDLSGARLRAVHVDGMDLEAPWLLDGGTLLVNGVDVVPFVDAELDRRFPGRALRRAEDPEALRAAWSALEIAWAAALARAAAMPDGTVEVSVDGEWSFAQTLRHLVMATDTWLRKAVLQVGEPYHPIGQPNAEYEMDGGDPSTFSMTDPSYAEVLAVRAERVAMVRDFLAQVSPAQLDEQRRNPWAPEHPETVRSCLHTILEEEWEHLRYATRDLDALDSTVAPA
jgi:uncharacterized protein YjbI with pentapeptide repeats